MSGDFILFGRPVKRGPAFAHPITGRRLVPQQDKPVRPVKLTAYERFIRDGKQEIERVKDVPIFDRTDAGRK